MATGNVVHHCTRLSSSRLTFTVSISRIHSYQATDRSSISASDNSMNACAEENSRAMCRGDRSKLSVLAPYAKYRRFIPYEFATIIKHVQSLFTSYFKTFVHPIGGRLTAIEKWIYCPAESILILFHWIDQSSYYTVIPVNICFMYFFVFNQTKVRSRWKLN